MAAHKRYVSIDFLKAAGILYMLALHQMVWLFIIADEGGLRYPESAAVLRAYAATGLHVLSLQLPLLAAVVFYFSARSRALTFPAVAGRAAVIAGLEFAKNFLTWGPHDAFDWDVLPFLGLAMIVSYPFVRGGRAAGLCALGVLGAAAAALADRFPFAAWSGVYPYHVIFGDAAGENYWPFFPWYSLFAAGLIIGRVLVSGSPAAMRATMFAGGALLAVSLVSGRYLPALDMQGIWGPSIFKPSPLFMAGILGFSLLFVPLTHALFGRFPAITTLVKRSGVLYLGQGILWIYLATIIAGYTVTGVIIETAGLTFRGSLILWPALTLAAIAGAYGIGRFVARRHPVVYE